MTSMSVNAGQKISFKINTPASSYHIDILRLGYYGGNGARMVASHLKPTAQLPQSQPACMTESATGYSRWPDLQPGDGRDERG